MRKKETGHLTGLFLLQRPAGANWQVAAMGRSNSRSYGYTPRHAD
jgi:hypothetical protein